MTIAVTGGLAIGVYYEAAAVTLQYLLGAGNRNASKAVLEKQKNVMMLSLIKLKS